VFTCSADEFAMHMDWKGRPASCFLSMCSTVEMSHGDVVRIAQRYLELEQVLRQLMQQLSRFRSRVYVLNVINEITP